MSPQDYYRIWSDSGQFLGVVRVSHPYHVEDIIRETFPNHYFSYLDETNYEKLTGILTIEEVIRST